MCAYLANLIPFWDRGRKIRTLQICVFQLSSVYYVHNVDVFHVRLPAFFI